MAVSQFPVFEFGIQEGGILNTESTEYTEMKTGGGVSISPAPLGKELQP